MNAIMDGEKNLLQKFILIRKKKYCSNEHVHEVF